MTYPNQETYSKRVPHHVQGSSFSSHELGYPFPFEFQNETRSIERVKSIVRFEPINETIDTLGYSFFLPDTSLTKSALNTIQNAQNPQVAKEAENLFLTIHRMMELLRKKGFNLPSLHAFEIDDGSVLIELSFNNLKVGFNIEPKQKDSGWYMVSNEELGEITASGYISSIDTKRLICWLFFSILELFKPYEITG